MNLSWYTAYVPATGEIVATFTSDEGNAQSNTPAGCQRLDGEFYGSAGYVSDGSFVEYTEAQAAAKAARPGGKFSWSNQSMSWVDLRDLQEVKDAKWAEIKGRRDQEEYSGFTWDGSMFDSDPESQTKIIGATQLANMNPASFLMDWTLKDNTVRTLNGADMVAVGQALAVHVNAQHVLGRTLRQQIEAATSAAEVNAVHWPDDTP
jgi:hypothetical protein